MAGEMEAVQAGAIKPLNFRANVLAATFIRIDEPLYLWLKLIRRDRVVAVPIPPDAEHFRELLPFGIARLGLNYPFHRVLTAERQQRIAHPRAPICVIAQRTPTWEMACESTPTPDRQQVCQKLCAPLSDLTLNIFGKRSRFGMFCASIQLHYDEAPCEVFRQFETVAREDYQGGRVQCY
jgi:hypothetical protein